MPKSVYVILLALAAGPACESEVGEQRETGPADSAVPAVDEPTAAEDTTVGWRARWCRAEVEDRGPEPEAEPEPPAAALRREIDELEAALEADPDGGEAPARLLRLGRLKKQYESVMRGYGAETDRAVEHARAHPDEYWHAEIWGDYLYNGYHFEELLRRFPDSQLADDAAYEIARMSNSVGCEGFIACHVQLGFEDFRDFLARFPDSEFAGEAVERANEAFRWPLCVAWVDDLNTPTETYRPEPVRRYLAQYDTVAADLPAPLRVRAYEFIADLWAGYLDYDRARQLYRLILERVPDYEAANEIRERMESLPTAHLVLAPADVIGSSRIDIRWEPLPNVGVQRYEVYRLTRVPWWDGPEGTLVATLPADADTLRYSDRQLEPATDYWYQVIARTGTYDVASNRVYARTKEPEEGSDG